jgi:hypothetical protein
MPSNIAALMDVSLSAPILSAETSSFKKEGSFSRELNACSNLDACSAQ